MKQDKKYFYFTVLLCVMTFVTLLYSAQEKPKRNGQTATPGQFFTDVPANNFDIILTRPTKNSMTVSILAYQNMQGYLVYGTKPGMYTLQTPGQQFDKDKLVIIILKNLQSDTRYYYQFRYRFTADQQLSASAEYTFNTQRLVGKPYCFTITADSHLDDRTTPGLYLKSLQNSFDNKPDFHVDLGDTFMTEKHANRDSALKQYLAQRYYFGQLCHSAPLFLVIGNHDGETVREQDGTANSLAVWSNTMRKQYFPNPVPDQFYTGSNTTSQFAGQLQNYYAWTWGDAQFIVLDPYWYTPRQRGVDDNWARTLGSEQYLWLKNTLETSKSKYKFVFIHHLVGGIGKDARGGIEAAQFYEWGGKNVDGSEGFSAHRPGWAMPIHQLLVKNHVSAVFHGHDHLYVKQEMDGIIYQEVPQPGWEGRFDSKRVTEYGYVKGIILGSSGHLQVKMADNGATVDYIRAVLPEKETNNLKNGTVVSSYIIK